MSTCCARALTRMPQSGTRSYRAAVARRTGCWLSLLLLVVHVHKAIMQVMLQGC